MITKDDILSGIASPQGVVGIALFILFALTLARPGHMLFLASHNYSASHNDLWTNSAQVLIDVENLEPSKLVAQGNIDDAVAEATRESNEHPNDLKTIICAGNVLSQYGDKEKGFALLHRSVDLAPQSRYVRINYARRLAEANRTNEAIDNYQNLCKAFPKQFEPHFELAAIYLRSGKPKEAAAEYKVLLDGDPNSSLIKKDYGVATASAGDEKTGFDEFVSGCSVGKDETSYASVCKSIVQNNANSERKAIGDMKIEVATKPKQISPRITYAQLLLYLDKYKDAKDVIEDALKLDASNPELYMVLAEADLKLNDKDGALSAFKKAVSSLSAARQG